jgi:signal transduction histidine kinase
MAHLVDDLLDDLLDMARLSEGKAGLRCEPVALDGIVNEAVDISMPLVDAGRHTLARHLPAGPVTLHIARARRRVRRAPDQAGRPGQRGAIAARRGGEGFQQVESGGSRQRFGLHHVCRTPFENTLETT